MKTLSGAFQSHLDGGSAFLATLWRVTRVDGVIHRYTDHDNPLTVGGFVYESVAGYTRSAITSSADMAVDSLELKSVHQDATIAEDDLRANKYQGAEVLISLCVYTDLTITPVDLRIGWLGQITLADKEYTIELRGLSDRLQQTIGRLYGRDCDADLGDARCGVDLTLPIHNATGTAATVVSDNEFTDPARTETKWTAGKLTWTSGNNAGVSIEIKKADGAGTITLWQPMPKPIVIGDAYAIKAGCQKRRLEDCVALYNNAVNYRGFDTTPGNDYLTSQFPDQQ